jgi:Predicted ATPase
MTEPILIAKSGHKKPVELFLLPGMANRHGLIAGATGTGKTVSLQTLAENFSRIGVPIFMSDVKGDLSGIRQPGKTHPKIDERVKLLKRADYPNEAFPVTFWDVFGEQGHPVRSTISEMGPLLLANGGGGSREGVVEAAMKSAERAVASESGRRII